MVDSKEKAVGTIAQKENTKRATYDDLPIKSFTKIYFERIGSSRKKFHKYLFRISERS